MLNTWRILGHYLAARRRFTVFRDRASLASWQQYRLRTHLRWIARHSPYYHAHFEHAKTPVHELSSWPLADKRLVTRHLAECLTARVDLAAARMIAENALATRDFTRALPGGITVGLSSGTTGPAAMFLVSTRERAAWAGLALARVLRHLSARQPQRVAFFLRANSPLYETLGSRTVRFHYHDLQRPVAASFEALERSAPTVLVAPPSVLRILAAACGSDRLRISPRQVVSVAEVLDADDRAAVENAFGVCMDEAYQASEGFLAATCPAGSLHWNEDVLKIERDPLGAGRYYPILTDFRRRLQPVIRYRLDDVVTDEPDEVPPCACGSLFRRIRRIEGRQDDNVRLDRADGAGSGPLFADFVRLAVSACAREGLEDFRVRQTDTATLAVSLRPELPSADARAEFLGKLERALAVHCAHAGLRGPSCRWMPWPQDDGSDGRKRRRVVGLPTSGEDVR